MRYRNTEELKATGIKWLREIPEEWDTPKIKWLFKQITSGSTPSSTNKKYYEGGKIPWVQTGDLNDGVINGTNKKITRAALQENSALKLFPEKTLLIAMYGATIGKLGMLENEAATNQACCALIKPRNTISEFIFYWLFGKRKEIVSLAYGGGQPNISQDVVKNLRLGLPPLTEQRSIAAFLDRKTEAIDGLIQKKEQLIERLKEKRQALITQAVTKGLDPDMPMKDSGIEWLGEIPEEWESKDLKFIAEVHSSNVDKKSNKDEEKVELCNYTDVYYNEFITNDLEFMKATAPDSKFDRFQLEEGDVIITKDSEDPNDIAVPALVTETKENLLCGYHLALIKCKKDICGEFLFRLFQSKKYREEFGNRSNGITRYGLGVYEIKNIEIALPSLDKQKEIIENLNNQTKQIDNIISETLKSIPKLNEYRQSLISAAVTGKIDVRDEVEVESQKAMARVNRSENEINYWNYD